MSENPSEANDQELEQVSGGISVEQLKMQSELNKRNAALEAASTLIKKLNDTNASIIRRIG